MTGPGFSCWKVSPPPPNRMLLFGVERSQRTLLLEGEARFTGPCPAPLRPLSLPVIFGFAPSLNKPPRVIAGPALVQVQCSPVEASRAVAASSASVEGRRGRRSDPSQGSWLGSGLGRGPAELISFVRFLCAARRGAARHGLESCRA